MFCQELKFFHKFKNWKSRLFFVRKNEIFKFISAILILFLNQFFSPLSLALKASKVSTQFEDSEDPNETNNPEHGKWGGRGIFIIILEPEKKKIKFWKNIFTLNLWKMERRQQSREHWGRTKFLMEIWFFKYFKTFINSVLLGETMKRISNSGKWEKW